MTTPDVSVIIVTYNSAAFISRCLEALRDQQCSYEVIVADNDSRDGTVALLEREWPDVRVISMGANTGFSRGNNAASRFATGRHLLLLNGDAWLRPGALARLAEFAAEHPDAGVVAPRLLNPDGTDQGTARSFPTPAAALFGRRSKLTKWFPGNPWSRDYLRGRDEQDGGAFEIDWVSGACLMTPRTTYLRLGGLDEGFFMHWEDTDYCRRVRGDGLGVYCLTTAQAMHAEGGSREGWPVAQIRHFHRGAYRYYAKHHLAAGPRKLWRPIVAIGLGLRAVAIAAKYTVVRSHAPSSTPVGNQVGRE
jgi:N-acetylglucosaminyl-diphospho-decaprenol L-rhamnosyltransferase